MNYDEEAAVFDCAGESLVGILSIPERCCGTAVIVIVGGPQYRAGSHRQFVLLARRLAAAGYATLRFDYRGMGDSSGDARNFEGVGTDIAAAIEALRRRVAGIERIMLWGLCDGASAALLYCQQTRDPQVTGVCLLNPWVRSTASLARTHVKHYYAQRLMQREFWTKLLGGGVAMGALGGFVKTLRLAGANDSGAPGVASSFQQRMAEGWSQADLDVLLLLSGDDYTAKEFLEHARVDPDWSAALQRKGVTRHDLEKADHTFSDADDRTRVEQLTIDWLNEAATRHRQPPQAPSRAQPQTHR